MNDTIRNALGVGLIAGVAWLVGLLMEGAARDLLVGLGGTVAVVAVVVIGVDLIRSSNGGTRKKD